MTKEKSKNVRKRGLQKTEGVHSSGESLRGHSYPSIEHRQAVERRNSGKDDRSRMSGVIRGGAASASAVHDSRDFGDATDSVAGIAPASTPGNDSTSISFLLEPRSPVHEHISGGAATSSRLDDSRSSGDAADPAVSIPAVSKLSNNKPPPLKLFNRSRVDVPLSSAMILATLHNRRDFGDAAGLAADIAAASPAHVERLDNDVVATAGLAGGMKEESDDIHKRCIRWPTQADLWLFLSKLCAHLRSLPRRALADALGELAKQGLKIMSYTDEDLGGVVMVLPNLPGQYDFSERRQKAWEQEPAVKTVSQSSPTTPGKRKAAQIEAPEASVPRKVQRVRGPARPAKEDLVKLHLGPFFEKMNAGETLFWSRMGDVYWCTSYAHDELTSSFFRELAKDSALPGDFHRRPSHFICRKMSDIYYFTIYPVDQKESKERIIDAHFDFLQAKRLLTQIKTNDMPYWKWLELVVEDITLSANIGKKNKLEILQEACPDDRVRYNVRPRVFGPEPTRHDFLKKHGHFPSL